MIIANLETDYMCIKPTTTNYKYACEHKCDQTMYVCVRGLCYRKFARFMNKVEKNKSRDQKNILTVKQFFFFNLDIHFLNVLIKVYSTIIQIVYGELILIMCMIFIFIYLKLEREKKCVSKLKNGMSLTL